MGEGIDGWMGGWMDGWMGGWMKCNVVCDTFLKLKHEAQ